MFTQLEITRSCLSYTQPKATKLGRNKDTGTVTVNMVKTDRSQTVVTVSYHQDGMQKLFVANGLKKQTVSPR